MCALRNNVFMAVPLMLCLFTVSCGFIDLRPVDVSTVPGKANTVLPEVYSPVMIDFGTEMEKAAAERLLQISWNGGSVEGDLSWKGNTLFFVPVPGWKPGVRYTMTLSGSAFSRDGRELRLDRYLPFYAVTRSSPPLVESFFPPEGASVGVRPEEGGRVEIRFSVPMDRQSVETSFMFEGSGKKIFSWDMDDTLFIVKNEKPLVPWTMYQWKLDDRALSREGVPLGKNASGRFVTDLDKIFPVVTRIIPMIRSGGTWLPSGGNIEGDLGPGQGIGIEFNKNMGEYALRSVRFDPSLPGRSEFLSPSKIVFIPDRDPEPETVYTLTVSSDAEDTDGMKMGTDHTVRFTADIPFLKALSFEAAGTGAVDPDKGPVSVPVTGADGELRFTLRFSLPFTTGAKLDTAFRIALDPYFPGTLMPISLRFVEWLSDDRIRMEWEGLEAALDGHYYRLVIPGGRGGINNGSGMYLKEDLIIVLEAIE